MKQTGKKLLLLLMVSAILFALPACGKNKKNDSVPTEISATPEPTANPTVSPAGNEENGAFSLPVEIDLPENATVREEKEALFADTADYFLYVFSEDTVQNGAVYDENDVMALINSKEKSSLAKEILRLKDFSIAEGSKAKAYESINGMRGYLIPMSQMTYEDAAGGKKEGAGFVVVYGKPDDVGVYVVLGILKANGGNGSLESENGKKAINTALGLIPKEAESGYIVWDNAMPDETGVRFAYKNGNVLEVRTDGDDLLLPFNEDASTGILIRHSQNRADRTAKELLQGLMDSLKDDGTSFSEIVTVQGRVEYQKVTMSYTEGDQKMKEILCLASDETGSSWLLDLYGTEADVDSGEEELKVLLWSLEEE